MTKRRIELPSGAQDPLAELRRGGSEPRREAPKTLSPELLKQAPPQPPQPQKKQLVIDPEKLKQHKVFIATPMYGGQGAGMYQKSVLDLQTVFASMQIENKVSFLFNESLITRGRNYLVDEFLRSGYSHMLFLDADIDFDPRDILALLSLDKEIIGAPYPKKSINWSNVWRLAQKIKEEDCGILEEVIGDYVFNPVPGITQFNVFEPVEVLEIGTGYMLIKREVFDKMKEAYPTMEYKPDHIGQAHFDGSRKIHAYFDCAIDRGYYFQDAHNLLKRAAAGENVQAEAMKMLDVEKTASNRYLSEDYLFCQMWRKTGGKIWLCPWMKTKHVGTYNFTGNMATIAQMIGRLK